MEQIEVTYWRITILQAKGGDKEAMEKLQVANKQRAEIGQPTIEEELENIHYLHNKNLFESSFLTNAERIFSLIKKEKYDEALEQFSCISLPLRKKIKIELRDNKGYASNSKPYILTLGIFRDYNIFKHIKIEPSALGAWQAFLLFNLWHVLPVFWHGYYAKHAYILSNNDLEQIQDIPYTIKRNLDVSPVIKQAYNVFTVSCCYWSEFQGLVRETLRIVFKNNKVVNLHPKKSKFEKNLDYKQEVLFKYHCGIEF